MNRKKAFRSTTLKRTPNPIWEKSTELLITDRKSAVIGVQILDDNTIQSDGPLGNISIKLEDILETTKKGEHEYPLSGVKSGRIFLTAVWKPVLMSGAINGSGAYTPPIGVVRILSVLFLSVLKGTVTDCFLGPFSLWGMIIGSRELKI